MRRTPLLVLGLLAGASLLVSTGAVPFQSGTDEIPDADIEMRPADGPNGDYAVLNENDEIELLLTGENPYIEGDGISENTVTPIDHVFTINYTGDRYAEVWITDHTEDVQFFYGDDPADSVEERANNVTLQPGETVSVGLLIDTRGEDDVESAENFTVNARVADPEDVAGDASTESSARDASTGGSGGLGDSGDSEPMQQGGNVGISVVNASLSQTTVAPGDSVTVTAVVENPTTTEVTVDTSLLVGADTVSSSERTIPAGDARKFTFEIEFDDPGTYQVAVEAIPQSPVVESDTAVAGTVVVDSPTPSSESGDSNPGKAHDITETPADGSEPPGTGTETQNDGTETPSDGSEVRTPHGSGNPSNQGQLLAVEEPLGIGLFPLLTLFAALSLLLVALRVWRRRRVEK